MKYITSRKHACPVSMPRALAATLLAGCSATLPSAVFAHPADAAADAAMSAATLDKVEVTATRGKRYGGEVSSPKFTQPLVDTPQTIQVIGSDLFNEQGATTLTDALRNSPGVGTFYAGENGATSTGDAVFMRGFDAASSIFVDGVRDLGSVSRDMFNIEQIEVTKGPASSDYGRSSPTGAINLVSKQAQARAHGAATLLYGSAEQRRATADWNQPLDDSTALRLNLMAQDSGVPGRDVVRRKRWGVAPSLAFGLGTSTRLYLDLLHVVQHNIPDGGVPTIGLPGYTSPDPARPQIGAAPRVDARNFYGTTSDHDDVDTDMATLRFVHDFSIDASLRNTTRWGRNNQDYLLTSFMASADPARFMTPDLDDPGTWTLARSLPTFKDQQTRILANQTNLQLHLDGARVDQDLTAGVELMREDLHTRGQVVLDGSAWPAANLYAPDPDVSGLRWAHDGSRGDGRTDTAALYLFDTLKFGPHWQLNLGARADRYRTRFSSLVACGGRRTPACGALPTGSIVPGVDARNDGTLVSWKLGALYKPGEATSLYANYATAQQPPGGGSLELSDRENSADNAAFDPQRARTAEVGGKWELADGNLLLTAALYDTRIDNEVVQDPIDQLYYQTGRKRVRGIELGAVGQITEAWNVSAGFTTLDTEVLAGTAVTADGSTALAYTPDRAFTAWTSYAFGPAFSVGGGARYSGAMERGSDGAIGTPTSTPGYWVFDAFARYSVNRNLELRLNLNNLFDRDYIAAINKSGYRYVPGAPRTATLNAIFSF